MKIYPEHAVRKIDKGGRLTIPSGIRNRFDFNIGDKMEYFVIESEGVQYVAFKPYEEEVEEEIDSF